MSLEKMPPLPLKVMREMQALEIALKADLTATTQFSGVWDEYLRTYSTEMFDVYYAFYSQFPEDKEHWLLASAHNSAYRLHVFLRTNFLSDISVIEIYQKKLIDTVMEYGIRKYFVGTKSKEEIYNPSGSIASQLTIFKEEGRLSAQALADGINVNLRTVQRHLTGKLKPRATQIAAYETFLTERLRRPIKLETPQ